MEKHLFFRIWMVLAGVCLLAGCGDKIEPGNIDPGSPATVKTGVDKAVIRNQPFIYEALGTISAQDSSTLSGKIMGVVKAVNVQVGDQVSQGDILVVLDEGQVAAGLRQSQAGLEEARKGESAAISSMNAARAGAELARTTFERYRKLYEEESATRQEFEEVEARHLQAQAALSQSQAMVAAARSRVRQAEAAVSGAGISQKDARVLAPYDGIISAKMINAGDLAVPGTPLLTLEKEGGFQVELVVPEHHIQAVQVGQSLDVRVPAQEGLPVITGTINTIAPVADLKSRSFAVKLDLPETALLRSGMFARVSIPVGADGMLLIPESARIIQGQLTGYFQVDDSGIARFRLMRTGRHFGDQIEVISGLQPGVRYVVAPPDELRDGMKVEEAS